MICLRNTRSKKKVEQEPRNLKKIIAEIEQQFNKIISIDIVKRTIKSSDYIWKRIRKSLKTKRDEDQFRQSQEELKEWQEMADRKEVDLYYFDESGFSLNPVISYAWQKKGTTIEIPSQMSAQLNVLAFMNKENHLESFVFTGSITSDIVIECFNLFASSLQRKTIVVLDNAPIHTSDEFDDNIDFWEQQGLFLYFLPPYSPELNAIEILWQRIKYLWLPFSAYLSFSHLSSSLDEILSNFGSKYKISFT
ncbi:MAG: IS630 family transposase [Blastocatellia bacterium]|nr:IS630 family transposase [Blastocatellia bacterium]